MAQAGKRWTYDAEGNKTEEWSDSNGNSLFDGNDSRYNSNLRCRRQQAHRSSNLCIKWHKLGKEMGLYADCSVRRSVCSGAVYRSRHDLRAGTDLQSVETISPRKIGATTNPVQTIGGLRAPFAFARLEALEAVGGGGSFESPLTDQGVCLDPERL